MGENKNQPKYDLEERTTEFGKRVIRLCKALANNAIKEKIVIEYWIFEFVCILFLVS